MALDDQLAALAAGELDDDTARALRARAAANPALARRLARHEQLQQQLAQWEVPPMSDQGVRRLEARIEEALAALDDGPLEERTPRAVPPTAASSDPADTAAPSPTPDGVADIADARRRRADTGVGEGRTGWPSWGAGAAVAAVLAAIVGTGVLLGGLPGGVGSDMLAGDDAEETADMADQDGSAELFSDDAAGSGPAEQSAEEEAATDADVTAEQRAELGPARRDGVIVAEGDLLSLVEMAQAAAPQGDAQATDETAEDTEDTAGDDGGDAATAETGQACVEEALRRDTAESDGREVWLLAEGTYAGADAVFVVVRVPAGPQDDGEDRYEVLAYDPVECSLLARDATSG